MSPTQRERREQTTAALITAARELFAADGYAATSLDAVVDKAGMTKGALYHHFSGKRELFTAVFSGEQDRLSAAVIAAYQRRDNPWEAFEEACSAFIVACQEPGVQRILLHDAPSALGWETIRELESGMLKMMERGIERAIETGSIEPRPVQPLAHLLFGAICESAMVVARATDQQRASQESLDELRRLLRSLRT